MKVYAENYKNVLSYYDSNENGLSDDKVVLNGKKFGKNQITKPKGKSLYKRIISALSEPMLIILEIALVITFGVNLGKMLKSNDGDFYECIGIVLSISISVALTIVMEGKSQKAFQTLNSIYEMIAIKVYRNGNLVTVNQKDIVCGDIVYLESGDKIVCDGRLISDNNLEVDESMLTGESTSVKKHHNVVLDEKTPLADRVNMVYSGTFVTYGSGLMVVTGVGDNAEIGIVSGNLQVENCISAPLQEKLDRLGKIVACLGLIASAFVLILNLAKIFASGKVTFELIEGAFLNSIILIVASVPEGLPTIVAIALTLNVMKLYKSNALIKKLVAAETVGCVSVICSDKTGTLTENKMKVRNVCPYNKTKKINDLLAYNIAINSTAEISNENIGLGTEVALIKYLENSTNYNYKNIRKNNRVASRELFDSNKKYMSTTAVVNNKKITYYKGAPEVIIKMCKLNSYESTRELKNIGDFQSASGRVICFASSINNEDIIYDGFIVLSDGIRKDVLKSINDCKNAGIKVKMLTGDNIETAFSIAKELKIATNKEEVVNAIDIEDLSNTELKNRLNNIKVVARSTPKTKLRIVTLLKEMGEVVAVTGDGVNDAPAIKHADIGIAMGGGSEVTKEASDIVLLDNSFSTIIKAISFGRNIYQNFQRFIMFQLSVNATAVSFIILSLILGIESPFTAIELLWINIIMDGPPALTLGLEMQGFELMSNKPIKRSNSIVTKKMFYKILIHTLIMCLLLILQAKYNFIGCYDYQMKTVLFNLFIIFQLFNAFNCRELGAKSVFSEFKKNKLMVIVFSITFVLQIIFSELGSSFFGTTNLSIIIWIRIILVAMIIVFLSEIYKYFYRLFIKRQKNYKNFRKSFN